MTCNSCKNGFDGKNGNGYQPCSCIKKYKPVVVCAACRNDHADITICGARHWDKVMRRQLDALQILGSKLRSFDFEQGFIDQRGNFLTRRAAMQVAKEAGQKIDIERGCGGDKTVLYSEGLY